MGDPPETTATGTGTLAGARDHARSQASLAAPDEQVASVGPTVPAATAGHELPASARAQGSAVLWAETIGSGGYASRRLPRGAVLRIADLEGDACAQLLVHNAAQPAERLNVADTVKVQWQAYLGEGALLLSDMGRVLMTVVADSSERHDCLCGASVRVANEARYGDAGAGGRHPSGRDLLALGVAKFGLCRRDVGPALNLFKTARVADDGALRFDGDRRPGTVVELRAELDVIVTVAAAPHPLDERPEYTVSPVRCLAWLPPSGAPGDDAVQQAADPFRASSPERARAFLNTDEYLLGASR